MRKSQIDKEIARVNRRIEFHKERIEKEKDILKALKDRKKKIDS